MLVRQERRPYFKWPPREQFSIVTLQLVYARTLRGPFLYFLVLVTGWDGADET